MINNLINKFVFRFFNNPKTTIGGGVVGVAAAALVGGLEEQLGCKFSEAFLGIDWIQIIIFVITQVFGALTTDANKRVK